MQLILHWIFLSDKMKEKRYCQQCKKELNDNENVYCDDCSGYAFDAWSEHEKEMMRIVKVLKDEGKQGAKTKSK